MARAGHGFTRMKKSITLVETPRDAFQGLTHFIPTPEKIRYICALLDAGFTHIDLGSFVSPKAVPQMADSEQIFTAFAKRPGLERIAIVVNEIGAQRAGFAKIGLKRYGSHTVPRNQFLREFGGDVRRRVVMCDDVAGFGRRRERHCASSADAAGCAGDDGDGPRCFNWIHAPIVDQSRQSGNVRDTNEWTLCEIRLTIAACCRFRFPKRNSI